MNHVQQFAANGATGPATFMVHRSGYISETFEIGVGSTAANIKTAIEGTDSIGTVSVSGGVSGGNGTPNVTFTNPANERLWFEKVTGDNWTTTTITAGTSVAEQLGTPSIDQIDHDSARLSPPPGGKPPGVTTVQLQLRTKDPGALDSSFSAWSVVINDVNFTVPTEFAHPSNKICEVKFVTT